MGRGAYTLKWLRAVLEHPTLRTRARMVAAALAIHLNADGEAWPAIPTLAETSGYATSEPVRLGLDELIEAGFLGIRRGGGRGHTHKYKALLPATERVDTEHRLEGPVDPGRGDESAGRVVSDPERVVSQDPNSSELHKNSSFDSQAELKASRELLKVPDGETLGSFVIGETRRGNADLFEPPSD